MTQPADRSTIVLSVVTALVAVVVLFGPGSILGDRVRAWARVRASDSAARRSVPLMRTLGSHLDSTRARPVIYEFSDYECPFCRASDPIVQRWLNHHPNVGFLYLQYPLRIHQHAAAASRAASCAGRQGRFREMHHVLMTTTAWQSDTNWAREAGRAGVPDMSRFTACLMTPAVLAYVDSSVALGDSVGITGTPTFIGTSRRVGTVSIETLDTLAGFVH